MREKKIEKCWFERARYSVDNMRTIFIRCHALVNDSFTLDVFEVLGNSRDVTLRTHENSTCVEFVETRPAYMHTYTYVRVSRISFRGVISYAFVFNSILILNSHIFYNEQRKKLSHE